MLRTWFLTVFSEMNSSCAMSRFAIPRATSRSTSISRPVSRGGGGAWGDSPRRDSDANSVSSAPAIDGLISDCPPNTARMPSAICSPGTSLSRYPLAPARTAWNRSDSSSLMVRMTILVLGATSLIAVHASIPDRRGIRMSIRTTSGSSSSARRIASAPSPASPTISMSGSADSTISNPRRYSAWSSATRTRMDSRAAGAGSASIAVPPGGPRLPVPAAHHGTARTARVGVRSAGRRDVLLVGGRRRGLGQPDHAVAPALAPVHHARATRRRVEEQEEVVADELHLVQGVVEGHRRRGVELLPDHDGRLTHLPGVARVPGRRRLGSGAGRRAGAVEHRRRQVASGLRDGTGVVPSVVHLAPVPRSSEPLEELLLRHVQRRVGIVGTRLGPDHRALGPDGDLHPFTRMGLPRVRLVTDLDVQSLRPRGNLLDLGQLLLEMPAESVRDGGVSGGDHDLHGCPPLGRVTWSVHAERRPGQRAASAATGPGRHAEGHHLLVTAPIGSGAARS